jgi:hypothetical protein
MTMKCDAGLIGLVVGIVGGLFAVSGTGFAIWCCRKKQQEQQQQLQEQSYPVAHVAFEVANATAPTFPVSE